jgi:hypothetical protein
LEVLECQPFGGPLTVSFAGGDPREHALGGQLAGAMRVELDDSDEDSRASRRSAVADGEDQSDEHA